jgi:hypothetical protein
MKPKRHNSNAYKSGLEHRFQESCKDLGWELPYEQDKIKYIIPESKHTYTPDFTVTNNVYIETKGLWTAADRKKACLIQEQHPEIKVLYVLMRNQKLAKNSKTTYLEWAAKHSLNACLFSNKDHWVDYIRKHIA